MEFDDFNATDDLQRQLHREILFARQRVYHVAPPTPLESFTLRETGTTVLVKREDRSPIHAYKWRGAYNRMALLTAEERVRGVVTASAGNHAQGVALAARRLGVDAIIYMPCSTPRMKQTAVRRHGGDRVSVELVGNSYDEASAAAKEFCGRRGGTFIHPYDDLHVMGGQGTLADEIVLAAERPPEVAYLQVGGGGMAAAVGSWLKLHFPQIEIVGVEGVDQASMAAAVRAGKPVVLPAVDVFCDGTAVRRAGDLTFPICARVVDRWVTVTNEEVSAAMQVFWEQLRCVPEPSGAMGLAAVLQEREHCAGREVLTILCGANMDFEQLHLISQQAALGSRRRRFFRVGIPEKPGALANLLGALPSGLNLVDLQYGITATECARPVIGVEPGESAFQEVLNTLAKANFPVERLDALEDVTFRVIRFDPARMQCPVFLTIEFHERSGALATLLAALGDAASIVYFNYSYSGERVGRALVGFDVDDDGAKASFFARLESASDAYRRWREVSGEVIARICS